MKYATKKKKVLVGALVACVAAIMATGSLAYLTFNDTAVNTFFVDGREATESSDFSIALYEDAVDVNGVVTEGNIGGVVFGELVGDSVVTKKPYVNNTSEDEHTAYVRLNVEVTNANYIATAEGAELETDGDTIIDTVMRMFGSEGKNGWEAFEGWSTSEDEWGDGWFIYAAPKYENGSVTFSLVYDSALDRKVDTTPAFDMVKMPKTIAPVEDDFESFEIILTANGISATDIVNEFQSKYENGDINYDPSDAAAAFAFFETLEGQKAAETSR